MSKKKYASRTPRTVMGGIRAQTLHGGHARVWWSRRWTEIMEDFRLGARLGRGRNYAISGQVSELAVEPGRVAARVQGSNPTPYESEIRFLYVAGEARARLVRELRARRVVVARLLVGDLPPEVERLLLAEGCPLFPRRTNDVESRCTCPDWANPCKHLAAVYLLLGEAIAKNPLLLLSLRGVSRQDLAGDSPPDPPSPAEVVAAGLEPADAQTFYGVPLPAYEDFGAAPKTSEPAPLIRRLGPLPFWRGQERFVDTLEHLYARAAPRGWTVWTGEPLDLRREDEKVIISGGNLHLKRRKMRVDSSWL